MLLLDDVTSHVRHNYTPPLTSCKGLMRKSFNFMKALRAEKELSLPLSFRIAVDKMYAAWYAYEIALTAIPRSRFRMICRKCGWDPPFVGTDACMLIKPARSHTHAHTYARTHIEPLWGTQQVSTRQTL